MKLNDKVYDTFKGGYIMDMGPTLWQYVFCYGIFRLCKGNPNGYLTVPGTEWSLHFNTWGCKFDLPKFLQCKSWNFHIAFIRKFPFVVIGFKNVWFYVKEFDY